jgi:hypothetical protein
MVLRMLGRQWAGPVQDLRQKTARLRCYVKHHQNCGGKVFRKSGHKGLQGFHASNRAANYDDIALRHFAPPFSALRCQFAPG